RVQHSEPIFAEVGDRFAGTDKHAHLALGRVELHKRPFALGQLVGRSLLAPASALSWFCSAWHARLLHLIGSWSSSIAGVASERSQVTASICAFSVAFVLTCRSGNRRVSCHV